MKDNYKCRMELPAVILLLLWGFWVVTLNLDALELSTVTKILVPERLWGAGIFLLGVIETYFIHTPNLQIRRAFSVLNVFLFSFLAILYAIGNMQSTGFIPYMVLVFVSAQNYTLLTAQIRLSSRGKQV